MIIRISDYTKTPGGRYKKDGSFSGEEYRDEVLMPALRASLEKHEKLIVDLDGTYGYATSFLEETFGGLVRKLKMCDYQSSMEIKSDEDPALINLINKYIDDALKSSK